MDQATTSNSATFDRRQIYRPFLQRLNPIALNQSVVEKDLLVPPRSDPRDPAQPPIYEAFASAAELSPGIRMALVGGIGSGKTTELILTLNRLKRHSDAVNILLDATEFTDFVQLSPGAMLADIGLRLFHRSQELFGTPSNELRLAHTKLVEMAFGKWVPKNPPSYNEWTIGVRAPGLMKPRFPELQTKIKELAGLVAAILSPFRAQNDQITVIVDGLDRLIEPIKFREFLEQDLEAIHSLSLTVIVAAPLLLWYEPSRLLQDSFDLVKHIPAAIADPKESDFLKTILRRRGAGELMSGKLMNEICTFSGGVLRDLLNLARSAAEYAYREDKDRINGQHVKASIRQLGNRYLVGLGRTHKNIIRQLLTDGSFSPENDTARELLVNRQVLEYSKSGRDFFRVHPALAEVLPE